MLLCAGKNFLQKSALRIQEKVLHQSDKRLFLLGSIENQRYMIKRESVLAYI